MRTVISRLLDVLLRRPRDARIDAEIQTHLDLLADEFEATGLSRMEAELAARRAFGGVDQVKARYRDRRGFPVLAETAQDVRYACRMMARERRFTAATVLALAFGIGATATMVTILYCMNGRGLPFDDAEALVGVTGEPTRSHGSQIPLAVFEHWRETTRSFEALSGEIGVPINLGDGSLGTDQLPGTYLSTEAFSLLRERPVLGRDFLPEDGRPGAARVAIVSFRVWSDRYGSDPALIGRTVRLDGQPATIIGVMPEGFAYPVDSQIWRPLASFPGLEENRRRPVRVVGRLARGVTTERAQSELAASLSTLAALPEPDRMRRTIVMPLHEAYVGKVTQPVPMMLLAAVVVVLLVACSHAASLLLARSTARARELSMRAALGASRARLVRQLLVESVVIALLAGVFGAAIAAGFVRAFAAEISAAGLPYWISFSFDPALAGIIAVLCVSTGVVFGILPAIQHSKTNPGGVLTQVGRPGIVSRQAGRLTAALLVGELAVTVILLSAASGLVRSANVVYEADRALDLATLWEFRLALPPVTYSTPAARHAFFDALDARLAAAPGMESAALASAPPFNSRDSRGVVMDHAVVADASALPQTQVVAIGPRYFDTLGLRLVRGTALEDVDASDRASVALVNERFVARFSPDTDPIGRYVVLVNNRLPNAPPDRFRIVGIAPPLRQQQQAGHAPAVYVPFASQPATTASLLVRGHPAQFAGLVRDEVRRIDADLPVFNLLSLAVVSANSRFTQRMSSTVFSMVAVIAIVLSAMGLYSLTAYAAAMRTQEVGVRIALGARPSQVMWLFLRRALVQVGLGLTIGLAGAIATGTVLQGMLVEVQANQPLALAAIAAFVVVVAAIASVLPARRASRLDPVAALRQE